MVTFAIELNEAPEDLARLIRKVAAGDEVLITRNGEPVARIVSAAATPSGNRVPGNAKGLFTVPEDFDAPLDDLKHYM